MYVIKTYENCLLKRPAIKTHDSQSVNILKPPPLTDVEGEVPQGFGRWTIMMLKNQQRSLQTHSLEELEVYPLKKKGKTGSRSSTLQCHRSGQNKYTLYICIGLPNFTFAKDNKPLSAIMKMKHLDELTSRLMRRSTARDLQFYVVVYTVGKNSVIVGAPSRTPKRVSA